MPLIPIQINSLAGGLNLGSPRDQLAPNESPDQSNMTTIDGVIQKHTGYTANAGTTIGSSGLFQGGYHYGDAFTGTKQFWAMFHGKMGRKALIGGNWDDATNSMSIQSGDDQYVCFTENVDKDDYKTYLLVCQNHTNPLTALNGTVGSDSIVWYANAPNGNLTALAGADVYNDGTGTPTGYQNHRAKIIGNFEGRVCLFNTYERVNASTWAALPYRVRWSKLYQFTAKAHWDVTDTTGSTSGYQDLRYGLGEIINALPLRGSYAIYLKNGIVSMSKTDSSTAPHSFLIRVPDLGLYAHRLIVAANGRHYFVGTDQDIYEYWGGADPNPIGQKVRTRFFKDINSGGSGAYLYRHRSFAMHFRDKKAVGFCVPTTSNYPDTVWVYYYKDNRWDRIALPANLTGWGEWKDALSGYSNNIPIVGGSDGSIYNWDYNATSWNGSALAGYVTTQDLMLGPKYLGTALDLWFEASADSSSVASSCTVSVSTDSGNTYSQSKAITVPAGLGFQRLHYPFAVTSYQMRFKFYNSSATQKLKINRVWIDTGPGGTR